MEKTISIFIFIAPLLFIVNYSFAITGHLRTEEIKENDIKGVFTLILYGARDINDIETVAILDLEGDQYTLEPYAPAFDYKVKKVSQKKKHLMKHISSSAIIIPFIVHR
jgi:hypothetical protein